MSTEFTFNEPPPPVMVLVVAGVDRWLSTLKLRISPAASMWRERPAGCASNAAFTMMSGCKLGTAVLVPLLGALVLPLPLSNCVPKKVEGKTTEPGANCWGFSSETPTAQLLVG